MRFLVFMGIFCAFLSAHSLKIFTSENDDILSIKSYFYGGFPCKNCKALLKNGDEILASSKTDENGSASLKMPENSSFTIAINAGGGHFKEITYSKKTSEISKNSDFSSLENLEANSTNSKNSAQNSKNSNSPQPTNSKNSKENTQNQSFIIDFIKGFGAIVAMFGVFALIFYFKQKNHAN